MSFTAAATNAPGYVYDNADAHAEDQHSHLIGAYDSLTTRRLERLSIQPGMRCLEVGAGSGSIATWLATRVSPSGSVLATDIAPRHIKKAPNLEVMAHNIVTDPLPEAEFDVIHARLVLLHLPERRLVLNRLAKALRPGGWLQIEDYDETTYGPLLLAPNSDRQTHKSYAKYIAAKQRLLEEAGVELTWGRKIAHAMDEAGLTAIDAEPYVEQWRATSPGTALQIHNTIHLADRLTDAGATQKDLEDARRVMSDPGFLATSCLMYSVQGQR
ncbi:methyltransferase domain-containing protein [Streptomyces sp. NPDC015127]|uniref:class I SAM-dependent methyltransferase n=1 Tax=Streptomyces sp. NPDC015127 TaxID=3364939 RepID=UPI0036FFEF01